MTKKILIVDDDKGILRMLVRQFKASDYKILLAESGREAIEILGREVVDLMILDQMMPEMDGITTFQKIKKRFDPYPPVIMFTAHGSLDLAISFMKEGGNDFVQKPVDFDVLNVKIKQGLEKDELRKKILQARISLKAEKEANKLKDEFIDTMNHELRTPLSHIQGFSELILYKKEDINIEKSNQYVVKILNACNELLQLVENVSDLLPILSYNGNEKNEIVNIFNVITELMVPFKDKLSEKDISFNLSCDENLKVNVDMFLFNKLLFSIIDNAVKFTDSGSVGLSVENVDSGCEISITDTGCGIPNDKFEDIFLRFYKISPNTLTSGTGLGLYICRKIVTIIGGEITVDSNLKKGSTFKIFLPQG